MKYSEVNVGVSCFVFGVCLNCFCLDELELL